MDSRSPTSANPFRRIRWLRMWSIAWGVLALVHVTQSIWLSRGERYPGVLGDGRFNQLLLEHGHQSLRGMATWDSPGQFYPAKHTLAYSDTHAGTLPIYTLVRRMGVSREEAWQFWFLAVTALNVAAGFRLFRALGISQPLRGPLVFASAGSASMAWFAGTHPQMLPIFPALLAWEQAARWCADRRPWRIPAAVGWFAWQFAAGPYSAFFTAVIGGFVGAARWLAGNRVIAGEGSDVGGVASPRDGALSRGEVTPPTNSTFGAGRWIVSLLIFLAGASLAFAVMRVYAQGLRAGHSRPLVEIIDGAPAIASWFTANPMSVWYRNGWPGGAKNVVEHAWFAGFLVWVLFATAFLRSLVRPRTPTNPWTLPLAAGGFATVLFFTKWNSGGTGLWVWVATHVESLHAFRSSGRVAGLLQFALVGAAGLLLTDWIAQRSRRSPAILATVLAGLLAMENLTWHQPSSSVAEARARTDALVAAWQRAGDRPILAFAPGFTNQSDAWMSLDAWSAALQLHRSTLNGYSGGLPATHVRFAWNPTVENARELIGVVGIPEEEVSIVETLGEEAERRLDYQRLPERQLSWLEGFDLQPAGWNIFAPLESFEIDGRKMHQFTPPAAVRFNLPDPATQLSFDFKMRDGSYQGAGHSDGVTLVCLVRSDVGSETELLRRQINPRDEVADRALLHFEMALPPGGRRTFVLRVEPGPSNNNSWDWPVFGSLRIK